jgi:hypothetical protein
MNLVSCITQYFFSSRQDGPYLLSMHAQKSGPIVNGRGAPCRLHQCKCCLYGSLPRAAVVMISRHRASFRTGFIVGHLTHVISTNIKSRRRRTQVNVDAEQPAPSSHFRMVKKKKQINLAFHGIDRGWKAVQVLAGSRLPCTG